MFSARQAFAQIARIMGWTQQAKLLASDPQYQSLFGYSIAISSNGNAVAVGVLYEDTAPSTNQGAVYIFTRSGTTWTQNAKLVASDAASYERFGESVAISGSGDTVYVGASGESTAPNTQNGAVYIFRRINATQWAQTSKLLASDRGNNNAFGSTISLSRDGFMLAVGSNIDTGAVYIFESGFGSGFTQKAKIVASSLASHERFGASVALPQSALTLAVGTTNSALTSSVYIYTRSSEFQPWTQQAKLVPEDPSNADQFGSKIAISNDGNTVVVGAPNKISNRGAVYVFTRSGTTWTQQAKLVASDAAVNDYFGSSVDITGDGNTIFIGASGESTSPNTRNGAAYVFTRSGTVWTQQAKLLVSDRADSELFGWSIDTSDNGNTVAIGAIYESTEPNTQNGAAYIFTRPT